MSVGASKNETVGVSSTEQVGYIKSTIVGKEYTIQVGESTIHMNAEGQIEIIGNNLQIAASEYVEIKGKKVCVNGGCEGEKKASAKSSNEIHDEQFVLRDANGNPMAGMAYTAKLPSGEILHDETDDEGKTKRFSTNGAENIMIYIGYKENV